MLAKYLKLKIARGGDYPLVYLEITMKYLLTFILLLLTSSIAQAHSIWLEKDGAESVKVYFGYWHRDLREESAKLKSFTSAKIFLTDQQQAVKIQLQENSLQANINTSNDVRFIQDSRPPRESKRTGKFSKTYFYAKLGRTETKEAMAFEMVPIVSGGNQFTVLLNGEPLSKAKVTVYGPPKWQQNLRSDKDGKVTINTPWSGTYIIRTSHKIKPEDGKTTLEKPMIRHAFTGTIYVKDGIKWQ